MAPKLTGIDHIHVFVSNRLAAEEWYRRVLGLAREPALESWASGGGPLTIADESGRIHLALFERPRQGCRSVVALGTSGAEFVAWLEHLETALGRKLEAVDHELSWSVYFEDPDGNPFEITSYEHSAVKAALHETRPGLSEPAHGELT
jgi:catechol 2,3-dioxygenase-like lactoylglutathione lyase family enzyme